MSETEAPPAKSGGAGKLIVIVFASLLLLGAGGGGVYFWLGTPETVQAGAAPAPVVGTGLVALEPFLVNLADRDSPRFLRLTLRLVVADPATAARVEQDPVSLLRVRSGILELLTAQTSHRLVTPEGKTELKEAIAEQASSMLGKVQVLDVLFSDFVVQF